MKGEKIISGTPQVADPHQAPEPATDDDDALEATQERLSITVDASLHGQRVDKALASTAPGLSRGYFQWLLDAGAVRLNDRVLAKPATRLKAGDRLDAVLHATQQAQSFQAEPMTLPIVFEDPHLIVLDKPAGWVVHPAPGNWRGTLLNGLLAHHAGAQVLPRAGIVHRLDKDTSGLMVVAKTRPVMDALVQAIAARTVQRIYLALARCPWPQGSERELEQAIGRDPRNRLRMAALPASASGAKPARTSVRVLQATGGHALLGCRLATGRTHQIRVHLAAAGAPLLGDGLYGGAPVAGLSRQALHAHRLGFIHPVDARPMAWEVSPPQDWMGALREVGLNYNVDTQWPLAS